MSRTTTGTTRTCRRFRWRRRYGCGPSWSPPPNPASRCSTSASATPPSTSTCRSRWACWTATDRAGPAEGLSVTALNDQHAFLHDPDGKLRVGDWVVFGISHPCTMFDRWAALPLVDADDRVTDLIRTYF